MSLTLVRDELEERLTELAVGDPADRLAALDAFDALPAESNLLYTPYIDLRSADLAGARLAWDPAIEPVPTVLPDDADGILVLAEGDVVGSALSDAAQDAGVELTTLAELQRRRPDAVAAVLDGEPGLPGEDKFARLTRALWSQGVVLDIPDGVRLAKPIVDPLDAQGTVRRVDAHARPSRRPGGRRDRRGTGPVGGHRPGPPPSRSSPGPWR